MSKSPLMDLTTGACAVAIMWTVFNNLASWDFTTYEQLTTVLIAGFMGLWGARLAALGFVDMTTQTMEWFFKGTNAGKNLATKIKVYL